MFYLAFLSIYTRFWIFFNLPWITWIRRETHIPDKGFGPNSIMCAHLLWEGFPTTPSNSWAPARCPTFQLNSDAVFLERRFNPLNPMGLGLSPTRLFPASDTCGVAEHNSQERILETLYDIT